MKKINTEESDEFKQCIEVYVYIQRCVCIYWGSESDVISWSARTMRRRLCVVLSSLLLAFIFPFLLYFLLVAYLFIYLLYSLSWYLFLWHDWSFFAFLVIIISNYHGFTLIKMNPLALFSVFSKIIIFLFKRLCSIEGDGGKYFMFLEYI